MSPLDKGRHRYAQRAADETLRQADRVPAVGHERASDKRIQISAAEAEKLIESEATKHTPGPWRFRDDVDRLSFGRIEGLDVDDGGVFTIAKMGGHLDRAYGTSGEAMANVRLIVAAPDLLAAAEDALAVLTIDLRGLNVAKPEIEKLRAAVARAKGNA